MLTLAALVFSLASVGAARASSPPARQLEIEIDGDPVRILEVGCRTGFRARERPTSAGPGEPLRATFHGLPDDDCTLYLKGAAPARWSPLPSQGRLICRVDGARARCVDANAPVATSAPSVTPGAAPPTRPQSAGDQPASSAATSRTETIAATAGPGPAGGLAVRLVAAPGIMGFEVSCRGGFRSRQARANPTIWASIPDDDCRLHFRGTPPAVVHEVHPGTRLDCRLNGVTAVCDASPVGG
jgi:hypothetical protein